MSAGFDRKIQRVDGYDSFMTCTHNGVVRLDENSDSSITGLSTYRLKTCICLILFGTDGKCSLSHIVCFRNNIEKIVSDEIVWMGDASTVSAIIVNNDKFLSNHRDQITNVGIVVEQIRSSLLSCRVSPANISCKHANYGAVCFHRQSHELIFPEPANIDAMGGKTCPYLFLRSTIQDLMVGGPVDMDIQYDGKEWTRIKSLNEYGILLDEDRIKTYEKLSEDEAFKNLLREPALNQLRQVPGRFLNDGEFHRCLRTFALALGNYNRMKTEYDGLEYRMYTMTEEQKRVILSIDGSILPGHRGMYVFRAPTWFLKSEVRQILKIDRLRLRIEMNRSIADQLTSAVPGWRAEPDYEKSGSLLLTYPYREKAHNLQLRVSISKIIA